MTRCGRRWNDDLSCFQGTGDAGNTLRIPDIRVPEKTEREDELGDAAEEGGQNADNEERQETEDGRKKGSNEAPSSITGEQWERRNGDTRALRHVPGGTWLTKVRERGGTVRGERREECEWDREKTNRSKKGKLKLKTPST
ncbi:hypothetical protein NDU88_000550 [Pleurodeles waltl]|uniref:Uncharacterized protein n=1 Tax=Pleurodeles waltl TaxID=8319 RepID=A0AAV7LA46_PLEWA|nr:hypothetical protein NDU88_000550 [Pleurodeles waltl]